MGAKIEEISDVQNQGLLHMAYCMKRNSIGSGKLEFLGLRKVIGIHVFSP